MAKSALREFVGSDDAAGFREFIASSKTQQRKNLAESALRLAATMNSVEVLKAALAEGGDVIGEDRKGRTALHAAVEHGSGEAVAILMEVLVEKGWASACIDRLDLRGFSVLHLDARP